MSKPLIFTVLLMATALLAGYAAEPEPQLISYKVTLRNGESVWDAIQFGRQHKEVYIKR